MRTLTNILLSSTLLCTALPASLFAGPQDGNVVAGNAQIATNGSSTLIVQSTDRAAIDWRSFDVKAHESVVFQQPSSSSVTLNRIFDQKPSEIFGSISANGQVILSNPNGMIFGKDSRVDVAGLVATTAGISSAAFMNNAVLGFGEPGRSTAKIINNGTITAKEAGLVALVAPHVENNGLIGARLGRVELAGAETATVDLYGDGLLSMAVDDAVSTSVNNNGTLRSRAGTIVLSAAQAENIISSTVNLGGILDVGASRADVNGDVVFGDGVGGDIIATGDHITMMPESRIIASGPNGGGNVHLGGGYQGAGPLPWAKTLEMKSGSRIAANATKQGNGGEVVLWSEEVTRFDGAINARGGAAGGNGGLIETSSKGSLGVTGNANAFAPLGNAGLWLLDPRNVTISNAGAYSVNAAGEIVDPGSDGFTILDSSISTALTNGNNVTITTGTSGAQTGNITLNGATIEKTGGASATLTLKADNSILSSGTITISSNTNALNLVLWSDANVHDVTSGGSITLTNATISTNGGFFVAAGGADDGANITDIDASLIYDGTAGDGRPDNYAIGVSGNTSGVYINNSDIDAGGGDIIMIGRGFAGAGGSSHMGVRIGSGSYVETAGTGSIYLRGDGAAGTSQNRGVSITDSGTGLYAVSGTMFMYGIGGGSGTDVGNSGFIIRDGATITSDGTAGAANGNIIIQGTGGNGTSTSDGVTFSSSGTLISTRDGDIIVKGAGGSGGGTGRGVVLFDEAEIHSIGTGANAGNIDITGTGGSSTGTKSGLQFDGNGVLTRIRTTDGDITLSGTGAGTSVGANLTNRTTVESLGDGHISITGIAAGANDITLGGNPNYIGNSAMTGNITLTADDITTSGLNVLTQSNVIIKPRTATRTIGISGGTCGGTCNIVLDDTFLATLSPDVDLNGVGSLIIGDSALANGYIDINGWDISGKTYDVEVHGSAVDFTGNIAWDGNNSLLFNSRAGNIILDYDFARNAGTAGDGTLTFKASGYITASGTRNVTAASGASSGKLHTIFWADAEAVPNNDGFIGLADFTLNTNNGDVVLGGGLDDGADIVSAIDGVTVLHNATAGDGRPDGYAWGNATVDEGVALGNTDILTGSGNIIMHGHGRNSATGTQIGVNIFITSLVETGSGTILLSGMGGNAGAENSGVVIGDASTIVRSDTGSITLNGTGGDAVTADNHGIRLQSSATVTSLSSATINLYGKGGSAGSFSYGNFIADSTVSSPDGDITITGAGAGTNNNHGIRISNSNITSSASADITLDGTKGAGAASNDFRVQGATTLIGGANATGLITIITDQLGVFQDVSVETQNNVRILPRTAGSTIGISGGTCGSTCNIQINDAVLGRLNPDVDGNGTGILIIGNSASGTGTVDIAGWDISGETYDVEVYGGHVDFTTGSVAWNRDNSLLFYSRTNDLTIDQDFARSAGGAGTGTLTFKASGSILSSGTRAVGSASGAVNTILWADADNVGGGNINLSATAFTTQDGFFVAGGGLDDGADINNVLGAALINGTAADGIPDTAAFGLAGNTNGVRFDNVDISSGSGYIQIVGQGRNNAGGGSQYGIGILNDSRIESGSGNIILSGTGGAGNGSNYGLGMQDTGTLVTSANGNIILNGRGNGTGNFNYGVDIRTDAQVTTPNNNNITITGRGGDGTNESRGVHISGGTTKVEVVDGDISITGVGGNATGTGSKGIVLGSALVSSLGVGAGAGTIALTGTGGAGTADSAGVVFSGVAGANVQSSAGAVQVTGTGGTGGTGNHGILADNLTTIGKAGSAPVTLTGTRGDTNAATYDITLGTGAITLGDANATGDITLIANRLLLANTTASTENNIIVKPRTEPTTIGISGGTCGAACDLNITDAMLAMLNPDVDGNGTGTLIFGDSADAAGTVDIAGWDFSNETWDVEVYGGLVDFTGDVAWNRDNNVLFYSRTNDIQIDRSFARNAGTAGNGTLTFKASGSITTSGSRTITAATGATSGMLHTVFWSDAEAAPNNDGFINLASLAVTSNNGDVILGGGLDNGTDILDLDGNTLHNGVAGDGRPDGWAYGNTTLVNGVRLNNADIDAGTGTILVKGQGWSSAGNARYGTNIYNGSQLSTTTGTILLNGQGGSATDTNIGINVQDAATSLTTGDGSIILMGVGGNSSGRQNYGLSISGDADIISNGTVAGPGTVRLYGHGGTGTRENYGINIRNSGTLVSANQHDIVIDGRAGAGNNIWNIGFSLASGADITSVGTGGSAGKITISGTGAAGTNQGYGVNIDAAGTTVTAVDGDISITGVGGAGSGTQNHGIIVDTDVDITSTGDSVITLTGTWGDTAATTYDIRMAGGAIDIGGADSTGNINLNADTLSLANHNIRTDSNITIKPRAAGATIGVSGGTCGATCTLNLADTVLAGLVADDDANGSGSLIIGDSAAGTGTVDINGWNLSGLNYDVEIFGGTVDFTGAIAWDRPNDLTFNSRTGNLAIDQTFTKSGGAVSNLRFNAAGSITQSSVISSSSGALNTIMDSDRDAAGAETITLSSDITSNGGSVTFSDAVVLGTNVDISSAAGNVAFAGTVNGAHDLAITTTGDVTFTGIVGGSTRLGDVTVTGGNDITASAFNAASFTQTAGAGDITFSNAGLNTTGDIDIDTAGDILGTYAGVNGSLYSDAAVNATVSFTTLDIDGTSADLLAGWIGNALDPVNQEMANRISINGVSSPALVANASYKFATFTIGYTGAPAGGGGSSLGGGTTPPAAGGGTTPPGSGAGSPGGGTTPPAAGVITPSFRQVLNDVISAQDTVSTNTNFGFDVLLFDEWYEDNDTSTDSDFSLVNERDLEDELNRRDLGTSKEDKKRSFKRKKLYRMSPELWRIINQ